MARIVMTAGLLAGMGFASTSTVPQKLTVHRSMRAVPRRFVIHPNGATLPVNQAQRFDVTDSEGKPVAVRWNVSGLGCSGITCGTIDNQGIYRTPSSLPHPRLVILEGVLVSDPRYSVLTEIRLETSSASNVNAASALPSTRRPETLAVPVVQGQNFPRRTEAPLLPPAVAAAPVIQDLISARRVDVSMPQQAVAAIPLVGHRDISRHSEETPLPQQVVAAPPAVESWNAARSVESPPLPHVVAAPPAVRDLGHGSLLETRLPQRAVGVAPAAETWDVARQVALPPPQVVAAAPVVAELNRPLALEFPVPQQVIAAPPAVEPWSAARTVELPPPHIVAAAPAVQELSYPSRVEVSLPQQIVAAPPAVLPWNNARLVELLLPHAVAAAPAVPDLDHGSRPEIPLSQQAVGVAPAVEKWDVARHVELPPLPNVVAAAPVVRESTRAPAVEYPLPQQIVAAPPALESSDIARNVVSPPLPQAVAAAPLARDLSQAPRAEQPLPQQIVAAPPALESSLDIARSVASPPLPNVVAASPVVRELPPPTRVEIPLPQAVAAAPVAEKWEVARKVEQPPLTVMGVSSTRPAVAGNHNAAVGATLSPLPVEGSAVPGETGAIAAHAPVVIYRNGQLTINAENATLGDVLKLVAEKTGATIDVPPGSGQERIVEHSGPGRANDILTQLLNGSHFNFIIVNSPQHPDDPTQVLLSLQRPETDTPSTASVAPAQPQASPYWKPPEPGLSVLPPQYDSTLTPPPQGLSPEALGELMKAKAKELLEKAQQEAPPQ
ncbi:MAG: hypothetical protein WA172_07320 [Terriglobales bacterium]